MEQEKEGRSGSAGFHRGTASIRGRSKSVDQEGVKRGVVAPTAKLGRGGGRCSRAILTGVKPVASGHKQRCESRSRCPNRYSCPSEAIAGERSVFAPRKVTAL